MADDLQKVGIKAVAEGVSGYTAGVGQINAANRAMSDSTLMAASSMQTMGGMSGKAMMALAVLPAMLGAVATGAVMMGIGLASSLEQSQIGFTTMLGSAEKAKSFLNDLQKFAKETPFSFKGLVASTQQLIAMGFSAEEALPMLRAIGDTAAGLGAGEFGIQRITRALGQMRAKGKISAEEMRQLAEMGVPAWEILATAIGVTIPKAMKMAEQGALQASETIPLLVAGMSKKFGGLMEAQAKTVTGMMSNIKDYYEMAMAMAIKPALPMIKEAMYALMMFLETAGPQFAAAVGSWVPPVEKNIKAVIGALKVDFSVLAGSMKTAAPAMAPAVLGFGSLAKIMPTISPTLVHLATAWVTLKVATLGWAAAVALVNTTLAIQIRLQAIAIGEATMFGSRMLGLAAMMGTVLMSWQFWMAALIATDILLRKITGGGLIEWATGAAQAQRRHAEALREVGDAQQFVNNLVKEGMSQDEARATAMDDLTRKANVYQSQLNKIADASYRGPNFAEAANTAAQLKTNSQQVHDQFMAMNPTLSQLKTHLNLFKDTDPYVLLFTDDLKLLNEAAKLQEIKNDVVLMRLFAAGMDGAKKSAEQLGAAVDAIKTNFTKYGSAISGISDLFNLPNPRLAQLELEKERLEAVAVKTKEQEKLLKGINAAITEEAGKTKVLESTWAAYGATLSEVLGGGMAGEIAATKQINDLSVAIANLPEQERIQISMLLPGMQMGQMLAFLDELERTHNVDIALRFSTVVKEELAGTTKPVTEMFAGRTITFDPMPPKNIERYRAAEKIFQDGTGAARQYADAIADMADAGKKVAEDIISPFDKVIDRIKSAIGVVDKLRSAFSTLFGKPSREEAQLNAKMAQLKLTEAQQKAAGYNAEQLKPIQTQIGQVQALLDIRAAEKSILQANLDLADKMLPTTQEQYQKAFQLTDQMGVFSGAMQPVIDQYWAQAQAMGNWMATWGAWLDLIGAPLGGFQQGGIIPGPLGRPRLILAHGGEEIVSLSARRSVPTMGLLNSGTPAPNYAINVNAQGATADEVRRLAHSAIDDAFRQAGRTSSRGGVPLSSGIG